MGFLHFSESECDELAGKTKEWDVPKDKTTSIIGNIKDCLANLGINPNKAVLLIGNDMFFAP